MRAFDIPILMYHDIRPDDERAVLSATALTQGEFEHQLDLLRRWGRRTVTFEHLFRMMAGTAPRTGREVLLTFDDGYESFRSVATPALLARGLTATVFVPAGAVGGHNAWDAGSKSGYPRQSVMDANGLREVAAAGMEVGAHGWAHRDLTACSPAETGEEIVDAKSRLQDLLGAPVTAFCYPYGRYRPAHFALLAEAGYRGAAAVLSRERFVTSNPYAMRRVRIRPGLGDLRFGVKLSALFLRYEAFRG
jgi:peptidoglycan/xylan/chitin deacetylase (PgdA/CDA1 family)